MQHEQELAEAHRAQQARERELKESLGAKLAGRLDEEKQAAKEELRLSARHLQDKATAEMDAAAREHRHQLQRAAAELEQDLERHREGLKGRTLAARERAHLELKQLQENSQRHIHELKQQHMKNIEQLQDAHEEEVLLNRGVELFFSS
jgi:hypothetical protein